MWAAFIVVILICGYHYTKCHLPSKYQQSKATGWNAYFDVALRGGTFFLIGCFFAVFTAALIYLISIILNLPAHVFGWYKPLTFAHDFFKIRVYGLSMFSTLSVGFTVLVSFAKASEATKNHLDPEKRMQTFREVANQSSIEGIILESVERGLLLLVTLKSRKVYVGMVDMARFNQLDANSLVLIPFMSGYRDKDTLSFNVEHNYVDYYMKNDINLTSEPLSVYQFRHVLPFEQIESFSLFNVNTYENFNDKSSENVVD